MIEAIGTGTKRLRSQIRTVVDETFPMITHHTVELG